MASPNSKKTPTKTAEAAPTGEDRLHKLIARAGIASRRAAEEIIAQGRVMLNGKVVTEPGTKANPGVDRIVVDGQPLRLPSGPSTVVLLHKPTGVVTTKKDPEGRTTVTHLMPEKYKHLHPIGRLDYDTSGVLFLTDDGELTHLLTHPSFGVEKVYWARVQGTVTIDTLKKLEAGIYLEDGKTAPCKARVRAQTEKNALVQITLHEGRNRQVRRMLEAVGHPVKALRRVKMGGFGFDGLLPGEFRVLIPGEVHMLRKAAESKTKLRTKSKPTEKKAPVDKSKPATEKSPAPAARAPHARTEKTPVEAHPLAKRVAQRFADTPFGAEALLPPKPRTSTRAAKPKSTASEDTAAPKPETTRGSRPAKAVRPSKAAPPEAKKGTTGTAASKAGGAAKSGNTRKPAAKPTPPTNPAYENRARRGARAWGAKTRKRA